VRHHAHGNKFFRHPVVGDLHMVYEAMEPMAESGLNFLVYSAEPGSETAESLRLLASWIATKELELQHTDVAPRSAAPQS